MKDYTCSVCKKHFEYRSNYYRHIKNKKKSCIPNDKIEIFEDQYVIDNSKIQFYETKVNTLEEEINRLKKIIDNINIINPTKDNINIIDHKKTTRVVKQNLNFNIELTQNEKVHFDHIQKEEMLQILKNNDFTELLVELVDTVYFNPLAPQNMKWCVTDKGTYFGAIEYNSETNTLRRSNSTNDIITKHLQILFYEIIDYLNNLRSLILTDQQNVNLDILHDMVGQESYKMEYINKIKDKAYEGRNFTRALWDKLDLSIEKTQLTLRVNKSKIHNH
jgi:hypothetical protein